MTNFVSCADLCGIFLNEKTKPTGPFQTWPAKILQILPRMSESTSMPLYGFSSNMYKFKDMILAYTTTTVTILPRLVPRDTSGNHKTCLNQKQFSTSPFQVLCASPQRHCISSGYTSKYAGNWDVCEHGMDYDTNLLKSRYCGNNRKTYYTFFNSPEVVRCFLHQIFFPDMRKNEMVKSTESATSNFHKFPPFIVVKCVFPNKLPRHIAQKRKYVDGCLVKAVRSGCL